MNGVRKSFQWLNKLKEKRHQSSYEYSSTYDDELMLDYSILSRPPMAGLEVEPLAPATFPKTLAEATAQPKATADILRKTLDGKIQLDDHPMYWDQGFFDAKAIDYFAPVFSHVCLFPYEEREALMAECTPLFEQLEASIRDVVDSIARGEMTADEPYRGSNAAHARVYLDKLTDLHMTRVDVVRGRYDDRMRLWREDQGRLFKSRFRSGTLEIMGMFDRGPQGYINFSYPRYEADNPEDEISEYPGQWLPSWGHPTALDTFPILYLSYSPYFRSPFCN